MCLLLDTTKSVTEIAVWYYLSNFFCCLLLPNTFTFYFKKLAHICKLLLKNILFKYICALQELSKSHIIKKKCQCFRVLHLGIWSCILDLLLIYFVSFNLSFSYFPSHCSAFSFLLSISLPVHELSIAISNLFFIPFR